jgi:PAS domain S-box-containing protein
MHCPSPSTPSAGPASPDRVRELYAVEWNLVAANTSRLLGGLLAIQGFVLAAIAIGYSVTGLGTELAAYAFVFGAVLFLPAVWAALRQPASPATRLLVAAAQVGFGSLFSLVTEGQVDARFHGLASLAFLSAYRDWRPLAVGTAVVSLDLAVRSGLAALPENAGLERASWIVFEIAFLLFAIRQSRREMWAMAERQANLESTRDFVERAVHDRTFELRAGEQRLKAVYNAVADGIITLDEHLAIESLNPSAERLLGFSKQDLVGAPFHSVIAGADGLVADALMDPALSGLLPRPSEVEPELHGLRRDGTRFPVELAIGKARGAGLSLVGVFRDITERRTAETALKTSEARYRQLFESNPHAMWVVDAATGHILAVNDAAVAHYGYDRAAFLTMTFADLDPSGETDRSQYEFVTPELGQFEDLRRHRLATGEIRQMELAARSIDFDGRPAVLMMAIDVTARKQLEEQLKQAQKLESIGQLAAGIAHEINTPIQYIGDNTTFVHESFREVADILAVYRAARDDWDAIRAADERAIACELDFFIREIPAALAQSLEGVGHVGRIVNALKEFAHPGTVEKTPVDLNRTLETVLAVSRNEWKHFAEIVTKYDPYLPKVRGLPGELNQVFLNLVVNAAHAIRAAAAAERAKGVITIETRRIGGMVEVRVADTGCGIPDAIRDRVFDPFFTTKPVGQGTGQGLSIAHSVVEQKHGGALSFESELGRGTTFIVRLPIQTDRLSRSERIQVIETVRVPASHDVDWSAALAPHSNSVRS